MSDTPQNHLTLQAWLQVTRDEEVDCDRFAELLGQWVDERIEDPALLALIEHHRRLCAECDEEASLVETALGKKRP